MKNLLFAFLVLAAFSCSEDLNPVAGCDVDNVFDLTWLKERIEDSEKSEIGRKYTSLHAAQYGSQTVFMFMNCCPYCSMAPPSLYDCSGNNLGQVGTDRIDWEEITDFEVIWKSSENECIFD
ncbi:hypothetical protein GCM10009119_43070 [Algoriphagus jejuensis]|uniref:Lipoprotein n=1 Tax=Algoriphagus jejuensis TaxID=419934 RepID=A0ABN1N605_9BACT